eukprot:2468473-Amphidinium_carterae.1
MLHVKCVSCIGSFFISMPRKAWRPKVRINSRARYDILLQAQTCSKLHEIENQTNSGGSAHRDADEGPRRYSFTRQVGFSDQMDDYVMTCRLDSTYAEAFRDDAPGSNMAYLLVTLAVKERNISRGEIWCSYGQRNWGPYAGSWTCHPTNPKIFALREVANSSLALWLPSCS